MKGLLRKDLFLLMGSRRSLLLLGTALVLMLLTFLEVKAQVLTLLLIIDWQTMAVSTVYYDQAGQTFSYLMSLPVFRRDYVREKYLLTLLPSLLLTCLPALILTVIQPGSNHFLLLISGFLIISIWKIGIDLPVVLKFGYEKSRIVTALITGFLMAFTISLSDLILTGLNSSWIPVAIILLGLLWLIISYRLSCRFLKDQDY